VQGETALNSVWAQDVWRFHERWKAVIGGRVEHWQANDGRTEFSATNSIRHPARSERYFSPKGALSWQWANDTVLKASVGRAVRFHLRDGGTSHEDLSQMLRRKLPVGARAPKGALLFSCLGRGEQLYGQKDHDSSVFHELAGAVPLGGFFCNGEIGPVQGTTFLHGYTSSFALFRPRVR